MTHYLTCEVKVISLEHMFQVQHFPTLNILPLSCEYDQLDSLEEFLWGRRVFGFGFAGIQALNHPIFYKGS